MGFRYMKLPAQEVRCRLQGVFLLQEIQADHLMRQFHGKEVARPTYFSPLVVTILPFIVLPSLC